MSFESNISKFLCFYVDLLLKDALYQWLYDCYYRNLIVNKDRWKYNTRY